MAGLGQQTKNYDGGGLTILLDTVPLNVLKNFSFIINNTSRLYRYRSFLQQKRM